MRQSARMRLCDMKVWHRCKKTSELGYNTSSVLMTACVSGATIRRCTETRITCQLTNWQLLHMTPILERLSKTELLDTVDQVVRRYQEAV